MAMGTGEKLKALGFGNYKEFNALLKSEVDKANKRLQRSEDFVKNIFADKGITKISRAGSLEDKLKALSQAKQVNNTEITTKTGYKKYVKQLSSDLSLSDKEVRYMLNSIDVTQRDFIHNTPLKLSSNPQIDFLFEDAISVNDSVAVALKELETYSNDINSLADYLGLKILPL